MGLVQSIGAGQVQFCLLRPVLWLLGVACEHPGVVHAGVACERLCERLRVRGGLTSEVA